MTLCSTDSDNPPNAITRPGPTPGALFEANWRLQHFLQDSGALDRRFNGPPPPYRSPSVTPVDVGPADGCQDSPESRRRLEEEARTWRLREKELQQKHFDALPLKERQRLIDQRDAMMERMEELARIQKEAIESEEISENETIDTSSLEERRQRWIDRRDDRRDALMKRMEEMATIQKEAVESEEISENETIDTLIATPPEGEFPDGLFAVPKNTQRPAGTMSPNLNHPTPTETRKRKHEIGKKTDLLALSDFRKPGSQAFKRARTRGADMQLNLDQHTEPEAEPVRHGVHPDEQVPSVKAAAEPPAAPSNSSPKRARKPRTARPATKAKPLTEILIRRSSRIAAMRSRKTESSKPMTSSKRRKNRKPK